MTPSRTPIEPSQIHRDVYPVIRVSTEYFLRGFDLLRQMNDDVLSALILMTIWHGQMRSAGYKPIGIRGLARKLDLPYETVRRHVRALMRSGDCVVEEGGLIVPLAVHRRRHTADILRRIYSNAVRVLGDLTRIEVTRFVPSSRAKPGSGRLTKEQMTIATAGLGVLLAGMKALHGFFGGDIVKGLIFTAIWAANVKHITNTAPAAHRAILTDEHRLPVNVLAISDSLRLPYETVRRHADALVKDGRCVRNGRQGLMIKESTFREMTTEAVTTYNLMMAFVSELRAAGLKV